jgi:hypothetical protein
VYGFAKSVGGHVTIYSEIGAGTIAKLFLPRSSEQPRHSAEPSREVAPLRRASGHETILVVEDDADVLVYAVEGLSDLGYRVLTAEKAAEALEYSAGTTRLTCCFRT